METSQGKNDISCKDLHINTHDSIIYNNSKVENNWMSIEPAEN